MVFDLDGGARHRWQCARRAAVTAELARVWLDPENGEKERGSRGERKRGARRLHLSSRGAAARRMGGRHGGTAALAPCRACYEHGRRCHFAHNPLPSAFLITERSRS